LIAGQDWRAEIPKAVRASDVVLVCLSKSSITREGYVNKEIKLALDISDEKPVGTIFIIPVRFEEVGAPERLQHWHWVNLFEEGGYKRLLRALRVRAVELGIVVAETSLTKAQQRIQAALNSSHTILDLSGIELTAIPEELSQLAKLRVLNLSGNRLTAIPVELSYLAKLESLYLGGNQLTVIPAELSHLAKLEGLDLSENRLTAIPAELGQLAKLEVLNLSENQLTAIPAELSQLANLKDLHLWKNQLTVIPVELGRLANLQELYFWKNQLTAIPAELSQLANLKALDLSGNQLTVIPAELSHLAKLEGLDLSENQLTVIPAELSHLAKLEVLDLSENQLTAIPVELSELANLKTLDLSENQLTAIPAELSELTNLQMLHLSGNQLTVIPAELSHLAKLENLDLSENQLTAIPTELSQLADLQQLHLGGNQLTAIPAELSQLLKLQALYLHGNPGLEIPDEILGPTWRDVIEGKKPKPPGEILSYYRSLAEGKPLNEAKLIMVGPGAVGKTSLVKSLKTGKFSRTEGTTEGIKIDDWRCSAPDGGKIEVHIWDFGGQELMHATHQFFLTSRSLYLLVLNRRLGGNDREADYWFRLIRAFGGQEAPVIVVLNKQKSEPFDVNRGDWLEKYGGNIQGFVATDCTDTKLIAELKRKIQEELRQMQSIQTRFPRHWFAIKNQLSQMKSEYLTFDDYRSLCQKYGEQDPQKQTQLAGFLHELGIALNYKDDPRLRYAYVLKPEWVTTGVYALLHAFVASKGLFARAEAERVLGAKGYSVEAAHFILGLMEQFELGFPLRDRRNRILIPQLLEDQQPVEAGAFNAEALNSNACLNFGYQYQVVPEGLLPRLIVRTHHLSRPETRWKSGVILQDRAGSCRALVRASATENQVRIHVVGPELSRRDLLAIIRHNFDDIHADYEFHPEELVYSPQAPNQPFRLKKLESLIQSGETLRKEVLIDGRVIEVNLPNVLEPVNSLLEPLKLFLSYAHKDEKYLQELRKDLKLMERDGLVRIWSDHALTAGEKWEPRILEELKQADVILCQLSRDFLDSDFCMLTELDTAIQRKEEGSAELIAYLLKDCGWSEVPRLKQFQILPKGMKPLQAWRSNKDGYWRAVATGIREVLEKLQKEKSPDRLRRAAARA